MSTATSGPASDTQAELLATWRRIERRVLWLAVRVVDDANRERSKGDALEVGGIEPRRRQAVTCPGDP